MTSPKPVPWVMLVQAGLFSVACAGGQPASNARASAAPQGGANAVAEAAATGTGGTTGTAPAAQKENVGTPNPAEAEAKAEPTRPNELAMPIGFVVLGPNRRVPISTGSFENATLKLASIRLDELPIVRPILLGYYDVSAKPLASLPRALQARLKPQFLKMGENAVDVFARAGGEFVLAALEAPGVPPKIALFQRGELSTLLKIGEEGGVVWITSTRDGRPVAGANVTLRQGKSERFHGVTDRDGLLRLPAERRLRIQYVPGAEHPDISSALEVVAKHGKHVTVTSESWTTGIEPWLFQLPESYYRGQDALRGNLTSERGIYRPGDSVHLLGVLRQRLANGKLAPPIGKVTVRVFDPDGNQVHTTGPVLSEFGTFRSEFAIGRSARLGRYSMVAEKAGMELRGRFEVGEYRPVRFEVKLPPASELTTKSEKLSLPVTAAYLYGAPVAKGKLSWTISARAKTTFGEWSSAYSFGGGRPCDGYYCEADASAELVELARGEGELDERGNALIEAATADLDSSLFPTSQALDLVVEASVRDVGGDVVTGRSTQAFYRTRALVGLASDVWVVNPRSGFPLKLLVSGGDGKPRAGEKVVLRLVRRKWVAVAGSHADARRYQGGYQDEIVATRSVVSAAHALPVHFPLSAGGEYRVDAVLEGATVGATQSVWAYGSDAYGAWDNHARMTLRADRASYRSGDTAKIYADVPYEKAFGLLTLEREGVLEARVLPIQGAGTPIEIPLDERRVPNVFASLAVVPSGLESSNPAAGPPLRIGYQELKIDPEKRRLRVAIEPKSTRVRPGESVDVLVRVADAAGRPARAEVTLWAADEGVLKLTGYTTPDPFVPAYERHSHQVRTSASLLRWVVGKEDDFSEYGGDAGPGNDGGAAFRSRFLGTAFFSKALVTDGRGEARVRLPLPDNLTRWRVMAAVADSGERFGAAETAIETSKPLQVEPSLPRFLTRGDELEATVLVHNRTDRKGTISVSLDVSGAELTGPRERTIELDRGAQAPVRFSVRALTKGPTSVAHGALPDARFRASASFGAERDGFDVSIPVHTPTLFQTQLIGEGRLDQARSVAFELPKQADPSLAELDIAVAPGVLASIGGSLDALLDYPHGCVEQTTSRLIPMVLLEEVLRSSGDPRLATKEHRDRMEQAVRHVLDHQNSDGGFGLWPSSESEGFLTAYALFGLFTARDHGYGVPASSLTRGVAYLSEHGADGDDMHGQFAPGETKPFAAYVLAAAKQDDRGLGKKLAEAKHTLSHFGMGLLGAAFAQQAKPANTGLHGLLGDLGRARRKTSLGALIAESDPGAGSHADVLEYGRDLRATAAAVRALTLAGKGREADDLIAGILDERRSDGSWGTTYNNLWALHALVDYAQHVQGEIADGRVQIVLGAAPFTNFVLSKSSRYKSFSVPADRLPAPGQRGDLRLAAAAGSPFRFTARLRFASTVPAQTPIDRGFSITRALFDAKTGAPVKEPKQAQLLRVRLQVTTQQPRKQVAVIDRLPAGFEPVDTALLTSAGEPNAGAGGRDPNAMSYVWTWRELHDERVTHFSDDLPAGTHTVEYLARASRIGTFLRPAPSAEMMYQPDVFGHGAIETVRVR